MKILLQITSGKGPAECERAVYRLVDKLLAIGTKVGLKVEVEDSVSGSMPKTYLSAVVSAEGETAEGETAGQFAAKWVGSIKWVAQSPFRPTHKRKNWFVGVAVLDLAKEQTIEAKDIRYETLKASGPGGQHVNKTESAVRATHVPTGESSVSMEERSQHMNKKRSYEKLQARIASLNLLRGKTVQRGNWMNHNELERGNPIQTFKEKL